MKYMKRAGIYKGTNVEFDPQTCRATSYRWWLFVAKIEGRVVFNDYRYSVTTAKHQSRVRDVLVELGIKPAIIMPVPKGLQAYDSLAEMILAAEEHLCDKYLESEEKREYRNEQARHRKAAKRLQDYLENTVHFRDYEIKMKRQFGHINTVAVHQVVDRDTLSSDVDNALHNFSRDGFSKVVFYV